MPPIKPGIYYDVPESRYRAWKAVNQSSLKKILSCYDGSPLHYQHHLVTPVEPTPIMVLGSALDQWCDDPRNFRRHFNVPPVDDKRTTEYKEWVKTLGPIQVNRPTLRAKASASIPGMDTLLGMAAALEAHPVYRRVHKVAKKQVAIVWKDPVTGILCKGLIDILVETPERVIQYDRKSTADTSKRKFHKLAWDYGYFFQLEFYNWGYEVVTGRPVDSTGWFAVSRTLPHVAEVFEMADAARGAARDQIRVALDTLAACEETNEWPGPMLDYERGDNVLDVPKWAQKDYPEHYPEFLLEGVQ